MGARGPQGPGVAGVRSPGRPQLAEHGAEPGYRSQEGGAGDYNATDVMLMFFMHPLMLDIEGGDWVVMTRKRRNVLYLGVRQICLEI